MLLIAFSVMALCACRPRPQPLTQEERFSRFLDSLHQSGITVIDMVNEMRRYVSRSIDLGQSQDSLAYNYHKIPWEQLSPFYCLQLFEQDSLTAKCGLTSYILAKLYHHAGFDAYTYACGYDSSLSHEFVLVKLNGKLTVQDPFFGMTITDKESNPLDFFRLLQMIKAGSFSDIRIVQDNVTGEGWLSSQAELDSLLAAYRPFYESYEDFYRSHIKRVSVSGSRLKILLERNYDLFSTPLLMMMKPKLREEGLKQNFLSIYLKPLHIRNAATGEEEDSLKEMIRSIVLN